jgi:hypothetical protein
MEDATGRASWRKRHVARRDPTKHASGRRLPAELHDDTSPLPDSMAASFCFDHGVLNAALCGSERWSPDLAASLGHWRTDPRAIATYGARSQKLTMAFEVT